MIDIVSQVYIIKDTKLKGNYRICLATVYLRIKQQYGEKRSTVGTNKNVNCLLINTSRSNLRQLRLFKWIVVLRGLPSHGCSTIDVEDD